MAKKISSLRTFYNRISRAKKIKALNMCYSKARRILVNQIIYSYFSLEHGTPYCFRCGEEIVGLNFHIDHKEAWLFSECPQALFFDLDNLALSHPICNSLSRRSSRKYTVEERRLREIAQNRIHQQRYRLKKKLLQNK